MKKVAFSYRRLSSYKQLKESGKDKKRDSLDSQFENATAWCKKNDAVLDTNLVLIDKAVSGFSGENTDTGKLALFRDHLKDNIVGSNSYLLLDTWTRCSRADMNIQTDIYNSITNFGVTIVTLDDGEEYSKAIIKKQPFKFLMLVSKMIAANQYSEMISRSSKNTWARRRKETTKEGKVFTKRCPEWLSVTENEYKPKKDKVATLNKIFDLCIKGYGNQRIANYLNGKKTSTMSGKGIWQTSQIARILKNKKLIGIHEFNSCRKLDMGKRLPIKIDGTSGYSSADIYPKVISFDKWDKVKKLKENRTDMTHLRAATKHVHIFAHLLKCGYYGCSMRRIFKGEYVKKDGTSTKNNGYYISTNAANNVKPNYRHGWQGDMLEDAFADCMPIMGINVNEWQGDSDDIRDTNEKLAEVANKVEHTDKVIEQLRSDLKSLATTENQRRIYIEEIEKSENELGELRQESNRLGQTLEQSKETKNRNTIAAEMMHGWRKNRHKAEYKSQVNTKLKFVIDKIDLFGGGFEFNEEVFNNRFANLLLYISKEGDTKDLPNLTVKHIFNLNQITYNNNHFVLDAIIRNIIMKHLPEEKYREAYRIYISGRVPSKDKSNRFFRIYPKDCKGQAFTIRPRETFSIGHGNMYKGIHWYAYGKTLRLNMVQKQVYHFEGYNPRVRHIGGGESKSGCLDNAGYWLSKKQDKGWKSMRPPWAF